MAVTELELAQARDKAKSSAQRASEFAQFAPNVGEEIKKRAAAAYKENRDIVQPLDKATSEFLVSPQVGREKYQDVFNPFTREKLVAQSVQNTATPMNFFANLLNNRFGNIDDIITGGTNAYNSQLIGTQEAAKMDRANYQDLYGEFLNDRNYALELAKFNASQAKAGGQASNLASLLNMVKGGGQPTEMEPMYSPQEGIGAMSPGGEWVYSKQGWQPVGGMSSGFEALSPEQIQEAITLDLFLTGGQNVNTLNTLFDNTTKLTAESASARKGRVALQSAAPAVTNIIDLALTADTGVKGSFKALTGRLPSVEGGNAELLDRDTRALAKQIAGVFQSADARATDQDIERWLGLMPRPGDTYNERLNRANNLIEQVRVSATVNGMEVPNILTVVDPTTGDVYEADDVEEYIELQNQGYIRY